jgi:hypothetical protein
MHKALGSIFSSGKEKKNRHFIKKIWVEVGNYGYLDIKELSSEKILGIVLKLQTK